MLCIIFNAGVIMEHGDLECMCKIPKVTGPVPANILVLTIEMKPTILTVRVELIG